MQRIRVIPVLLIQDHKLVKSEKFKDHKYVGDPINAVKIFNEKEVDEIIVLDISATPNKRGPDFGHIKDIASEAFMPLGYGGGISSVKDIEELLFSGIEKVIINTQAIKNPNCIEEFANRFGSSTIVVSMDVRKNIFGKYRVYGENGKKDSGINPVNFAKEMQERGAGEIFLNAIDRDGTFNGYDIELIRQVSSAITIPVVACGGASSISDFKKAVYDGRASAVAAGRFFVFKGPHKAVLITYPSEIELHSIYSSINL